MIGKKIKSLIESSGVKYFDIAQQLGISYQNLNRILNKESVETRYLFAIAKILNIPVITFFEDEPGGKTPFVDVDKLLKENETLKETIKEKDEKINDLKIAASYIKAYFEYDILLAKKRSFFVFSGEKGFLTDEEIDLKIYSDPELIKLQKVKDEFQYKWMSGKIDMDISSIIDQ